MKILLTGAFGFLGWHTRVRLELLDGHEVLTVGRSDWSRLAERLVDVDAVVHVAGVNRGAESEIERVNVDLADDVAAALATAPRCTRVVFANSIQAGGPSAYGTGKARASDVLRAAASQLGREFVDVRLPNLFGEGGRARYNSFVATFIDDVIAGRAPDKVDDRPIDLLHAQAAARCLSRAATSPAVEPDLLTPCATPTTVDHVLSRLIDFHRLYTRADVPDLTTDLDVDLFNALRFSMFPNAYPFELGSSVDDRGRLIELVRARGSGGQTFVSTSGRGVTRGDHFHVRKVERFVVLSGQAQINLRRLYDGTVVTFNVDGSTPSAVDMPTLWTHNIVNVGAGELVTMFWTNELFDEARPDTIRCLVDGADLPNDPTTVRGGSSHLAQPVEVVSCSR